jgi:hypothetical protein
MTNITTTGPAGEPDRTAVPDAQAHEDATTPDPGILAASQAPSRPLTDADYRFSEAYTRFLRAMGCITDADVTASLEASRSGLPPLPGPAGGSQ